MELNKPYEVSEAKYQLARKMFSGILAHRKEGGKFYVKALWWCGRKKLIEKLIML